LPFKSNANVCRYITVVEARAKIWFVDSKGLVTRARAEKEEDLALHKLPWAHNGMPDCTSVLEAVKAIKPTALIGVRRHRHSLEKGALAGPEGTGEGVILGDAGGIMGEPPRLFTHEVLEEMAKNAEAPLIFALSRPESISECTAEQAYAATGGRCIFATGCPVTPFSSPDGRTVAPRASTSAYVFPVGLRHFSPRYFAVKAHIIDDSQCGPYNQSDTRE
jgi:malate dehydrogenase (oxaloacetate-decarboxylating)(NADP+)